MEDSDKKFVLDYVERMKKYSPNWDPEKSNLGDGSHTFGYYWNQSPRNYKALARIVRRVLSLTS